MASLRRHERGDRPAHDVRPRRWVEILRPKQEGVLRGGSERRDSDDQGRAAFTRTYDSDGRAASPADNQWSNQMIGWSSRNLVIDRFGLDYESTETNGLVWIDDLETISGKSRVDRRHPDHHKHYVQN